MCNLTLARKTIIELNLERFLMEKEPFTGRDVAAFMLEITHPDFKDVSVYVRELYNAGKFPAYWAAMKINGNDGPLLYFYVRKGTVARNVAEEIETNLKK